MKTAVVAKPIQTAPNPRNHLSPIEQSLPQLALRHGNQYWVQSLSHLSRDGRQRLPPSVYDRNHRRLSSCPLLTEDRPFDGARYVRCCSPGIKFVEGE